MGVTYKAFGCRKVIDFLGIKITQKTSKVKHKFCEYWFNSLQDIQILKIQNGWSGYNKTISEKLKLLKHNPEYLTAGKDNYIGILFGRNIPVFKEEKLDIDDVFFCWGLRPLLEHILVLNHANKLNKPVLFLEDSFLRSIFPVAKRNVPDKYRKGISFTIDDFTSYFDATRPSRLELLLNDKNLILTEEQIERARKCIDVIVSNNLTKYNHQPIYEPKIGRKDVKKVLVVDQSYGDMSITKGLANDETFKNMLECAIKENPDADIIIKTHPDTIIRKQGGGYFRNIPERDNIYLQTTPINPISLIKYVDKVYVCTTQLGFEALMCGKEVHTFGMPFYAGWGVTVDNPKSERRTHKRTLEEIFYITYIMYSYYVNPEQNCCCEIEEAMEYLLKLREEYFNEGRNLK